MEASFSDSLGGNIAFLAMILLTRKVDSGAGRLSLVYDNKWPRNGLV
jgi:hypothetical protein